MKSICATSLAAALAIVITPSALAGHGKAGLWESTVQMNSGPMAGMPDVSRLPPQAQAQMRAHGMQMGGNTITTKYCMTAAQVASDTPVFRQASMCKSENVRMRGNTFSADVVCNGKMKARGHVEITYSSPEHYSGVQTTDMVMEGRTMHTTMNINARWLSPNCGKVK
jgi:hypothetical protein